MSACFCRGVGSGCDNEGGDGCNSERSVITLLVSIQEETGDKREGCDGRRYQKMHPNAFLLNPYLPNC